MLEHEDRSYLRGPIFGTLILCVILGVGYLIFQEVITSRELKKETQVRIEKIETELNKSFYNTPHPQIQSIREELRYTRHSHVVFITFPNDSAKADQAHYFLGNWSFMPDQNLFQIAYGDLVTEELVLDSGAVFTVWENRREW